MVVFLEFGSSLIRTEQFGLLRRNLILYERFLEMGAFETVSFVSYAIRDKEKLAALKKCEGLQNGIEVLTPPAGFDSRLGMIAYSLLAPIIHRKAIRTAKVLKTQQVTGSWTALIAKLLYRKPLLFRLGYPLSIRFRVEGKRLKYCLARIIEFCLARGAEHIAVSSHTMRDYYGGLTSPNKITMLPSYVDLSAFMPIADYSPRQPILFVGRLDEVKNLESLISACGKIDIPLHIYGGGPQESFLRVHAQHCGAKVAFKGVVPNALLAEIHREHSIFVLCSTREGMPKALIEAMASGLICVVTRTEGGLEMIRDGETGYLIPGFSADSIELTLRKVLENIRPEVGRRASAFARRNNSLEHVVEMELEIIETILCAKVGFAASPRIEDETVKYSLTSIDNHVGLKKGNRIENARRDEC